MAPIVHPGRLLKRELAVRKLSANRLSLDIGVPLAASRTFSMDVVRSPPIQRCVSVGTSAIVPSSGSACKANMISGSSSRKRARRSPGASGRRTQRKFVWHALRCDLLRLTKYGLEPTTVEATHHCKSLREFFSDPRGSWKRRSGVRLFCSSSRAKRSDPERLHTGLLRRWRSSQ